jgi:hypothetical protein
MIHVFELLEEDDDDDDDEGEEQIVMTQGSKVLLEGDSCKVDNNNSFRSVSKLDPFGGSREY